MKGRPSKDRLKVLVSFLAFAYVSATGKNVDADGTLIPPQSYLFIKF